MSPDPLTAQPPLLPHLVTRSGTLQHLVFMKGLCAARLKCDQPSPVLHVVLLGLGLGTTTPFHRWETCLKNTEPLTLGSTHSSHIHTALGLVNTLHPPALSSVFAAYGGAELWELQPHSDSGWWVGGSLNGADSSTEGLCTEWSGWHLLRVASWTGLLRQQLVRLDCHQHRPFLPV